jgi:hypothetical protein
LVYTFFALAEILPLSLLYERKRNKIMLKISMNETPTEEKWILCGRLTAPWVREFKINWKKNHRSGNGRTCIVDLDQITFIDKSGERFLRHLLKQGAQLMASGVYTRHVLENLAARNNSRMSNVLGFF